MTTKVIVPLRVPELIGGPAAGQPVPQGAWESFDGDASVVALIDGEHVLARDASVPVGRTLEVVEYRLRKLRFGSAVVEAFIHDQIAHDFRGVEAVGEWAIRRALR